MTTEWLDATGSDPGNALRRAVDLLNQGETVAFPTETVYGLGARANDAAAVAKVFQAKGRPSDNPLIVHLADRDQIALVADTDDRSAALATKLMPGPLTLVLRAKPDAVADVARAGLETVAVRIPQNEIAREILRGAGPLVAPSANRSGRPSPTLAQHVLEDLDGRIAAIVDGGACDVGIESTVADLTGDRVRILRPGVVSAAEIEAVTGVPVARADSDGSDVARSPGVRHRHYRPRIAIRLVIAKEPPILPVDPRRLILTLPQYLSSFADHPVEVITERDLYRQLREAESRFEQIVAFAGPGDLPPGLMDRLSRAAGG